MKLLIIAASIVISSIVAQQQQQQRRQQQQQQQQQQLQEQVPPFLVGAPQNVVNEFREIIATGGQRTDKQMEQAIESWIARQNQKIQQAFQQFKKQAIAAMQQIEAQHKLAAAKFSPAAKQADLRLSAIAKDPMLTASQKEAQIRQVVNSLAPSVKQELQNAMQG
uniref:SXP/RAL-2 family protein Ani s 5-like cation-binding domain-containing protein n=1 Tax=Setaria digitata TaxID=48799 RepID=A0A915Q1M1_9BILA